MVALEPMQGRMICARQLALSHLCWVLVGCTLRRMCSANLAMSIADLHGLSSWPVCTLTREDLQSATVRGLTFSLRARA